MYKITAVYLRIGQWAVNLFLLNVMWLLSSLAGLIIVGIFPATAALFTVLRKMIIESNEVSVVKLFWRSYKKDFIKTNILGYLTSLIGVILYFDIRILGQLGDSLWEQSLLYFLYLLLLIYIIVAAYIFPLFSHFQLSTLGYIKSAFILAVAKPLQTLLIIIGILITIFVYRMVPGLIPIFGISILGFAIMKITLFSLDIEDSKEES